MKSLSLYSYAKLNLYLRILKKRSDNYHSIFTIFERINLSDKIKLRLLPKKEIRLVQEGCSLPRGSRNLAYQAARLLKKEFDIQQGVEININKHIPISSGLGGGSSNAACVLRGLNQLWKLNLKKNQLVKLGQRIGADVPFFLHNTSFAYGTARGDKVKPLRLPVKLWHLIVVPMVRISSLMSYRKWDEVGCGTELTNPKSIIKIFKRALLKKNIILLSKILYNSFEDISAVKYPVIRKIRLVLSDLGLKAILMSGSGSAVFGLVMSRKEGYGIVRQLRKRFDDWDVFLARTV